MSSFLLVTAAPVMFFVSAWVLMIFAGILSGDLGTRPISYTTSLLATLAIWLVVAPLIGASLRRAGGRRR
ncbi:MAG: hypothetical protein WD208_09175 [Dehalococcoidia bacterium]